jgi:hypothetical protein
MCIFLGQKKYGIWGDFSEKFQVLCKNPDEVTRFDGTLGMHVDFSFSYLRFAEAVSFDIKKSYVGAIHRPSKKKISPSYMFS